MKWLLAIVAVVLVAGVALADPRTEAMLLFDQGQKEMKAGQFEKACNSFERSIAIYADSGTKGSLARCYEKVGRLASAWLMWRQLADLAPSADLRRDAATQAAKLAPKVAHYVLKIAVPAPGLTITINGKATALTDVPVPIDAGGVIVRAYAMGRKDWNAELTAADGATLTIEVPKLELGPEPEKVPDKPKPVPPPPPPPPSKTRKYLGLGLTGVGAVTIAFSGLVGLKARALFSDAKETCGGSIDNCIPDQVDAAQRQVDDARTSGVHSTFLFLGGGVTLAAGIVLYMTAPKVSERRQLTLVPLAAPSTAGVTLTGAF